MNRPIRTGDLIEEAILAIVLATVTEYSIRRRYNRRPAFYKATLIPPDPPANAKPKLYLEDPRD